jgi:hypothetical protein
VLLLLVPTHREPLVLLVLLLRSVFIP